MCLTRFLSCKTSVAALVILLSASYCTAQVSMQFSFYTDGTMSSDGLYVYNVTTIQDQSSGCYHSNYNSQATIYSPDGRFSAMGGGGATFTIAINYTQALSLTTGSDGFCPQGPWCSNTPPYRCNVSRIYVSTQGGGYPCPPKSEVLQSVAFGSCIVGAVIDYPHAPGVCTPAP